MAFFDFLSQGIGGTTPAVTEPGVMGEGDIVTSAAKPIGPTYGDIAKAAMMYGSKRGSSAPMLASLMPDSGWQQNSIIQPIPTPKPPATTAKAAYDASTGKTTGDSTLAAIGAFISGLFF